MRKRQLLPDGTEFSPAHDYTYRIVTDLEKSSGLAGALREKALDFFNSKANVVTEFERWENAEASLFSDPRFWNAEELRRVRARPTIYSRRV